MKMPWHPLPSSRSVQSILCSHRKSRLVEFGLNDRQLHVNHEGLTTQWPVGIGSIYARPI